MENKKIAIIGGNVSSGGLTAITRMILRSDAIPDNFKIRYYCSKELYKKIGEISGKIEVILSDGFYRKTLKEKLTRSYGKEFIEGIKEWDPDLILFIGEVIPKELWGYKTVFYLKNQFSFDNRQIRENGFNKLSAVLFHISLFARRTVRHAYATVFDTEYSRRGVEKCGYVLKRSKVIYMNVSPDFYDRVPEKKGDIKSPVELLYVSSVAPYKHQLEVIKGVCRLKSEGYNVHLSVVGQQLHKAYVKKCKKYVANNGMNETVDFIEWVDYKKMPELIDDCDVFLNASTLDTLAGPVGEAMARGAVIVANKIGFNEETLKDGGIYFDVNDKNSLADALRQVIDSKKLREKLSNRAKELANEYAKTDTASEYYKFMAELLNKTEEEQ
ncbi:MAG: glycosyltransferase [Clostridia bacterium]|nr:glycosyltransferase [Clostridia bacterium]